MRPFLRSFLALGLCASAAGCDDPESVPPTPTDETHSSDGTDPGPEPSDSDSDTDPAPDLDDTATVPEPDLDDTDTDAVLTETPDSDVPHSDEAHTDPSLDTDTDSVPPVTPDSDIPHTDEAHTDPSVDTDDEVVVSPIETGPDSDTPVVVESDLPVVDDSDPTAPIEGQVRCVFPPGVVIPDDSFRTLDLEVRNAIVTSASDYYPAHPGGEILGFHYDPLLGDVLNFYSLPTAGRVWHESLRRGRILPTQTNRGPMSSMRSAVDLDHDGTPEWIGFSSAFPTYHQSIVAFRPPTGDVTMDNADWKFVTSQAGLSVDRFRVGDYNGDGSDDIFVRTISPGGNTWNAYWLYGPFPPGEYVVESEAQATSSWSTLLSRDVAADFNDDGIDDLAIQVMDQARNDWFEVRIYFGPFFGAIDFTSPDVTVTDAGSNPRGVFGNMFCPGDLDGDGTDDLVIAITDAGPLLTQGVAHVFHGPFQSGASLTDLDSDSAIRWPDGGAIVGATYAALGDVDGDGHPEFAIGARASSATTPPDVNLDVAWPPGTPRPTGGFSENAIMVFGDPPPGDVGPGDAKFTIFGANSGDQIGYYNIQSPGDLNGDGLADISFGTVGAIGATVRVLYPCADFGLPPP